MWLIPDPRRRWRLAASGALFTPLLVAIIASPWAFCSRSPAVLPSPAVGFAAVSRVVPVLDPQAFQLALWRPFTDQPTVDVSTPAPKVTLFAVMRRQGTLTAALDFGAEGGLRYMRVGETQGVTTVVAVDNHGVDITVKGVPMHLSVAQ